MKTVGFTLRGRLLLVPLAVVAALVAACGGSTSGGSQGHDEGTPVSGGSAAVAINSAIDGWNPQTAQLTVSYEVFPQVYASLLRSSPDGKDLEPALASSYKYDAAGKTLTFTLDPRAAFSTGEPVTSADVKFSAGLWRAGELYGSYFSAVRSVTTPDPRTVVFHLSKPDATLPEILASSNAAVFPNNYGGASAAAYWKKPIGAGPFKIAGETVGQSINLVRNTHYYRPGLPRLDKLDYKVVTDDNQNLLQFQSGAIDIVDGVNTAMIDQYGKGSVVEAPSSGVSVLITQTGNAPTNNVDFRKGLAAALDYKSLVAGGYGGHAVVATTLLPQIIPGVTACSDCSWGTQDAAAAKQLVTKSGYAGNTLEILVATASPEQLAAQAMVPMLAEAGIKASVSAVPLSTLVDRLGKSDFQLAMISYSVLAPTPLQPLGFLAATNFLFSKADVAAAAAAVDAVHAASSDAEVSEAVQTFEASAFRSAALIPLAVPNASFAVSSRVRGFEPDPYSVHIADELWIND